MSMTQDVVRQYLPLFDEQGRAAAVGDDVTLMAAADSAWALRAADVPRPEV